LPPVKIGDDVTNLPTLPFRKNSEKNL